eukprot:139311-Pleurochrysis_carterae.AAC.1
MCFSKQAPVACEESTLKLREKCASSYAKRVISRAALLSKLRRTSARKGRKSERQKTSWRYQARRWSVWGWGRERENKESATAPAACAQAL